jgi:hypothetical protein
LPAPFAVTDHSPPTIRNRFSIARLFVHGYV